ncbi:MAG: alpha/beta fold hydrolase [Oscillospiraceae bacterium]|nr:alpha/beta fold hydrolase [Oscillospiraceae bacterium]
MQRYFEINGNGHNIRCKIICRELRSVRTVVVFGHGFGGHKDNNAAARFGEKLVAKHKQAALLTFDWPCHGDDVKKKLYLEDCNIYLDMVVGYVKESMGVEAIYAYGTSFGGYLMLKYLTERGNPFRKIALRCPALNIHDALMNNIMTQENREKLPKGKDIMVGFDRKVPIGLDFMKQLEDNDIRSRDFLDFAEDILMIHGTSDEIIPFREAQAFSEDKLIDLIPAEGADHRFRDLTKMDLSTKQILEFYAIE